MAGDGIWGSVADIAVAITAVMALVQPHFLNAIKKFRYKPRLMIEETAQIQLWTWDRGCIITLRGALLAEHKDFFVRKMSLNIVRRENNAEGRFEWHATLRNEMRFDSVSGTKKDEVIADLPYPFLVKQNQSSQYNLMFSHIAARDRAQRAYESVADTWRHDFEKFIIASGVPTNNTTLVMSKAQEFFQTTFTKSKVFSDALHTLDRDFFWLSGSYALRLTVHTAGGAEFSKAWGFSIEEEQERQLRDSARRTVRSVCNLEKAQPSQVWTSYEELPR